MSVREYSDVSKVLQCDKMSHFKPEWLLNQLQR